MVALGIKTAAELESLPHSDYVAWRKFFAREPPLLPRLDAALAFVAYCVLRAGGGTPSMSDCHPSYEYEAPLDDKEMMLRIAQKFPQLAAGTAK